MYLSIVLVISMLVSTVAAFLYFWNVTRTQHIRDEQSKLRQITRQMDFKTEDIFYFANSIAVDSDIQETLVRSNYETEFERVKARRQVADRLVFYNSLRNFIVNATILAVDGQGYSSRGFQNDIYYETKFNSSVLKEYAQETDSLFSTIYVTSDANTPSTVLCYKLPIRSIQNPSQQIGTLYLEIGATYFQQDLARFGQDYGNLTWSNDLGQMLYQADNSLLSSEKLPSLAGVERISGGYRISERAEAGDWTISISLTDTAIRRQSAFVIVFFALFFILTLVLMLATIHPVLSRIVKPITALTQAMGTVREGNLAVHPHPQPQTRDEIALLYQGFNDMLLNIQQYIQKQQALEQQKREMEFDILLSQINPHYLYNVLNTVVYLAAAENNSKIVEVVNAQIRILQENLKVGEDVIYTTIRDEMTVVHSYLSIQEHRYMGLFEFYSDIPEALLEREIPKAIIQPIVENALYHGVIPKEEKGTIQLHAFIEEERLIITVRDDGIGMAPEKMEQFNSGEHIPTQSGARKHIGLANARERIAFLYGEPYGIQIESVADQYTLVRIALPA